MCLFKRNIHIDSAINIGLASVISQMRVNQRLVFPCTPARVDTILSEPNEKCTGTYDTPASSSVKICLWFRFRKFKYGCQVSLNTPLEKRRVAAGPITLPFTPQVSETKMNFCELQSSFSVFGIMEVNQLVVKMFPLPHRERKPNKAALLISAVALPVLILHC